MTRVFLIVLLVGFVGIRASFRRIWASIPRQGFHAPRERALTSLAAATQLLPGPVWLLTGLLDFANIELPIWANGLGFAIGLGALGLLAWVHATLGANFSPRLELRAEHTLIQAGPYARVRHPMYTAGLLFVVGAGLASGNWMVGGLPLAALLLLVALRLPDEEAMLAGRFGSNYADYRRRTGALFPRLSAAGDASEGRQGQPGSDAVADPSSKG